MTIVSDTAQQNVGLIKAIISTAFQYRPSFGEIHAGSTQSLSLPESPSTMSALAHRSAYDQKIAEFLKDYRKSKTQQRYAQLAADTKAECEQLLHSMSIKGVVTSRTKVPNSSEKKLIEMGDDREFRDWVTTSRDITEHQEMGDLAGTRFGLYLPDDVLKVAKAIKTRYQTKHFFGTVTSGRDATHGRNLDIERHQNGLWYTRDSEGAEEYWEHSGYKSWQMVVQPQPHGPKIEIQIGTVVTQAWAEVQAQHHLQETRRHTRDTHDELHDRRNQWLGDHDRDYAQGTRAQHGDRTDGSKGASSTAIQKRRCLSAVVRRNIHESHAA
jgi:ppGpp synthetase/RelA/SpoT-type nucleotidyltranferase